MKQEVSSAVAIALKDLLPSSVYGNHEGERVTMATKAMLSNTDPLVGYTTVSGIYFFLHEKSPYSIDKEVTDVVSGNKATFKDEIVNFAVDYATQVEYDYASFVDAYNRGMPLY